MKRLIGYAVLLILMLPAAASAQQVGDTAQGSLLQSGGGGLQQAPAGLQGSTPQIFGDSSKGSMLDQSNQKLLTDLGLSGKMSAQQMEQQTEQNLATQSSGGISRITLAGLFVGLAGLGTWLWFWLRRLEIS